jgi:hypothetical protein
MDQAELARQAVVSRKAGRLRQRVRGDLRRRGICYGEVAMKRDVMRS